MVRDDQVAPFGLGFVEHLLRDIHGQQRPVHLVVRTSDDKSRIVIGFLPPKRSKTFDNVGYFSDFHSNK